MSATYTITNSTGLHPAPGYILAEFFDVEDEKAFIKVPEKYKQQTESTQKIVVLEDSRFTEGSPKTPYGLSALASGTRILISQQDCSLLDWKGRKLIIAKTESVKAWFDSEN